ncbi:MAG: sigma-70 family RNA polymerase sigma factor [Sedimentisphaerales bacterium]|nr:sigma-70 family RNA polymerase sigma factor [Sedimentisphaerales bacterium]
MQHDDASLVILVLNGDTDAFGRLYDKYARLIRAICYGTTGDVGQAQDLAQEVFLRAYQKLPGLKSPDRFAPWLVAMAKNVCREYCRKQARDRHILVGLEPEEKPQQQPRQQDQRLDALNIAIEQLPEKEKLALRTYYLQDQDINAAMKIMGMSRSSFYRLLERARKNVEMLMDQEIRKVDRDIQEG